MKFVICPNHEIMIIVHVTRHAVSQTAHDYIIKIKNIINEIIMNHLRPHIADTADS